MTFSQPSALYWLPTVPMPFPLFGLANFIFKILQGTPKNGTTMKTFGRLSGTGEIGQGNAPFSNLALVGTLAEASSTVVQPEKP